MKTLKLVLLGALALAQLAVPAQMALHQVMVRARGVQLKIRCAPIDPVNPFMGRYVRLNLSGEVAAPGTRPVRAGGKHDAWITYSLDAEGFVEPAALHWVRPKDAPSLKVRTWGSVDGGRTTFSYPFDRYYLNEDRAPEVERVITGRDRNMRPRDAHVTVRVLGETAVLEELYLDGKPVLEYLREHAEDAEKTEPGG